ncbi:MAG: hypothetical protein HOB38_08600, partial [Deltaproteobacteria bacterium]|nr:hypothetical protein [Deltaproteobacteria bacterium]
MKYLNDILLPASIFKKEFSIDWLLEMSQRKASLIIEILDEEQKKGHLEKTTAGSYRFRDKNFQSRLYRSISTEKKQLLHQQAADIIFRELPD